MSDTEPKSSLPWYSRILVDYQHLTLALLIGICFGLSVSLLALDSSRDSAAQALAAEYASDVARLGADQSSQPLFNNDLLSLQVLLTSLVQLDQIQGLTVHDVENRLLAQAGRMAAGEGIYRSASITQDDSVAGYLTVIANKPGKTTSRNIWFALFALAMGVILSILLKRQLPFLQASSDAEEEIDEEKTEREISIDQTLPATDRSPAPDAVALTLVSQRMTEVAKQLNPEAFGRVLDELNRHINSVSALYGARQITAGHALPALLFDGKDRTQNTVNALCSAQLLLALSYRMKTPLSLHAQVEQYHRDGKLAELPGRFQASTKPLFLGIAAPLAEAVQDRFRFREDNGYWLETEEFGESYQSLLDNQLKQLLKTSGYDLVGLEQSVPEEQEPDSASAQPQPDAIYPELDSDSVPQPHTDVARLTEGADAPDYTHQAADDWVGEPDADAEAQELDVDNWDVEYQELTGENGDNEHHGDYREATEDTRSLNVPRAITPMRSDALVNSEPPTITELAPVAPIVERATDYQPLADGDVPLEQLIAEHSEPTEESSPRGFIRELDEQASSGHIRPQIKPGGEQPARIIDNKDRPARPSLFERESPLEKRPEDDSQRED